MPSKIKLGFFMYAPRLGGAEQYLRQLLWGVDRSRFDVKLFAPPWPAFDRFMGLDHAPPVTRVNVRVFEPGTRFGAERPSAAGPSPSDQDFGREAAPSWARVMAARLPLASRAKPAAQWTLRQAYWPLNLQSLSSALGRHPVDVLHSVNGGHPGATSARAAIVAAARTGTAGRVLTVCSTAFPRTGIRAIEAHHDGQVDQAVTAVIVPARRPLDALVQLRGFSASKLCTIPWGIQAPPPMDRAAARAALRRQWDLPAESAVIGTLGNFTPTKGHAVVVEAMALLRHRFPSTCALVAGEGPERPSVEALSRSLGLDGAVRFVGSVADVFPFLAGLDVFVLASDVEGLPLVVLEALSQGIPVVATDVGGMPDAVIVGQTGYLTPIRDAAAVARAVTEVIEDPSAAATMGASARAAYEGRFTLEQMIDRHQALYESSVR